ncbi:MAG: hypothetical protein K6B28_06535 [Lachnospiraceae bacterium]|nr:hypothetical protein [Lachnospiraceae bacterium]
MSEKNKTILIRIFFFIFFYMIMFFANRVLAYKNMHGTWQARALYMQPRNTVDVVMLGTSHIHCDVNTAVLWRDYGIAAYDYSAAEQPLWVTYYYLKEFCKYQTPKVAVLDLYAPARFNDDFNKQWLKDNLHGVRFSLNKIRMMLDTCTPEEFDRYLIPLWGYHSRYDELTNEDWDYMIPSKKEADFKGYTPFFDVIEDMQPELGEVEKGNLPPKSEIYLQKIIDYTRENGIELFLVVNPYPSTAEEKETYDRIEEMALEQGILYRNTNFDSAFMGLDYNKDYNDASHLNYNGSVKFSDYLGMMLKFNFDIPDRRGDPDYITWDNNVKLVEDAAIR